MMNYKINDGLKENHKQRASQLFWQAFREKLQPVMKPEEKALEFFNLVIDSNHAISAISNDEALIGIAGFKTQTGSFMGGELKELCSVYGWFGGTWRGLVLSLLERPLKPKTLLMDGIFVSEVARGQGIGPKLLAAIKEKAKNLDCSTVRLDVIDTNPRARTLYERQGFVAGSTSNIGPLRHLFGFQKSTTMVFTLEK